MSEVTDEVSRLSDLLAENHQEGNSLTITLNGERPDVRVLSLDPLSIEMYGFFRRGPRLFGKFALVHFFWGIRNGGTRVAAVYGNERSPETYGDWVPNASVMNHLGGLITRDQDYEFFVDQ